MTMVKVYVFCVKRISNVSLAAAAWTPRVPRLILRIRPVRVLLAAVLAAVC